MIDWASFETVGKEREYVLDALASGWVSHGPYVDLLGKRVEELFNGGKALPVANGTIALMLAFQTLDIQIGDRVIVPAFSFQAAANVLIQLGAEPVFCDVDPLNWNQTTENIESVLDDTIKGVVVVHNYGVAAEIGPIAELCKQNEIWLIEDAAEAWFTKFNNQYVGRFGDIATFSMHATKTIACGEGGMVLINREDLVEKAKLHRSHGLDRQQTQYKHLLAGNNYRLSNLLAAIAYAQIEQYEFIINTQSKRTALYKQFLDNIPGITFQQSLESSEDRIWADAIIIDPALSGLKRDGILARLAADNVDMRPGFYTPCALEYYQTETLEPTPVADHIAANICVLPCSPFMSETDISQVADKISRVFTPSSKKQRTYSICELSAADGADTHKLRQFIEGLPTKDNSFRYYDKREHIISEDHICTLLIFNQGKPIGYGHLDNDGKTNWLGIAIYPEFTGNKLGHTIMRALMSRAASAKISRVDLFVDRDNPVAQKLYLSHGFIPEIERSTSSAIRMFKKII